MQTQTRYKLKTILVVAVACMNISLLCYIPSDTRQLQAGTYDNAVEFVSLTGTDTVPNAYDDDNPKQLRIYVDMAYQAVQDAGVTVGMSQHEAWNRISGWIMDHATYDYTYEHSKWYDVLLSQTGTCNSYAGLTQILCQICGIDCYKVNGYVDGEYHSWNHIQLDGQWYWTDLTFADTDTGLDAVYFLSPTLWDDRVVRTY